MFYFIFQCYIGILAGDEETKVYFLFFPILQVDVWQTVKSPLNFVEDGACIEQRNGLQSSDDIPGQYSVSFVFVDQCCGITALLSRSVFSVLFQPWQTSAYRSSDVQN